MNYTPNMTQWRRGSIVIHDADAKEPGQLARVTGYTHDGMAKCKYISKKHKQRPWTCFVSSLHDPLRFGMYKEWADVAPERFEDIHAEWDYARRWNYYNMIGVAVYTTSADGGFEAHTSSKAVVWNTGTAMICIKPGGYWALNHLKLIAATQAEGQGS